MNYQRHYDRLVERARNRMLDGYVERHHVTPKCLGGGNNQDNIVALTAEEHYVAHLLLVKMHPENYSLLCAAMAMGRRSRLTAGRVNNKQYGWLRRRFGQALAKRNQARTFHHSNETKAKMSAASKGKAKSEAHRAAMSAERTGKKRSPHSEETKEKMRVAAHSRESLLDRSWMRTDAYRQAQSARVQEIWRKRKTEVSHF